jgi:cytochrome c oxidase assembly protein subunit 15
VVDATQFRIASRLSVVTVVLMLGLIILGSIVRTTGSGLACPDWPLCQGRLIPPFQFNVLIEWFHRLLALLVSVALFVTVGWVLAHAPLRARLGGLAALAVALLAAQILLGALTVWKLLDPGVVGGHLGVALLLFSTMLTLSLAAAQQAEPETMGVASRPAGLLPLFALTTVLAYGQCVLGGVVAASHAGLACGDWPTCNGEWFPPMRGLVGLQMAHRWAAYLLTVMLGMVALRGRAAEDPLVARAGMLMLGLAIGQIALGVMNILLGIRVWLSALHLANAAGILALSIASTFRIATSAPRRAALGTAVPS